MFKARVVEHAVGRRHSPRGRVKRPPNDAARALHRLDFANNGQAPRVVRAGHDAGDHDDIRRVENARHHRLEGARRQLDRNSVQDVADHRQHPRAELHQRDVHLQPEDLDIRTHGTVHGRAERLSGVCDERQRRKRVRKRNGEADSGIVEWHYVGLGVTFRRKARCYESTGARIVARGRSCERASRWSVVGAGHITCASAALGRKPSHRFCPSPSFSQPHATYTARCASSTLRSCSLCRRRRR